MNETLILLPAQSELSIGKVYILSSSIKLPYNGLFADVEFKPIFVILIQGFVGISSFKFHGPLLDLAIVSRLSSKRAGTRFNARGIDDNGNVSNFVEVSGYCSFYSIINQICLIVK